MLNIIFLIFLLCFESCLSQNRLYIMYLSCYIKSERVYGEPNHAVCVGNSFCLSRARKGFLPKIPNPHWLQTAAHYLSCHSALGSDVSTLFLYASKGAQRAQKSTAVGPYDLRHSTPPPITLKGFVGPLQDMLQSKGLCHFSDNA